MIATNPDSSQEMRNSLLIQPDAQDCDPVHDEHFSPFTASRQLRSFTWRRKLHGRSVCQDLCYPLSKLGCIVPHCYDGIGPNFLSVHQHSLEGVRTGPFTDLFVSSDVASHDLGQATTASLADRLRSNHDPTDHAEVAHYLKALTFIGSRNKDAFGQSAILSACNRATAIAGGIIAHREAGSSTDGWIPKNR